MKTISDALELAVKHHRAGRLHAAEEIYAQILATDPDHADALHDLGVVAAKLGKLQEATASFRRLLALRPDHAVAHYNLGNVFYAQGNLEGAVACFRQALELRPDYAEANNNLGNVLKAQGELERALAFFRRALELKPDYAEAHSNMGHVLQLLGKLTEAIACYELAITLKPDAAAVHYNLGTVLQSLGEIEKAVACYHRALDLKPDFPEAINNLGTVLNDLGKSHEAVAFYRRALELNPKFSEAWGNLLFALQYRDGANLSELAAAHAEYERLQAAPLRATWRHHENGRDPQRGLHVGFVSADFGQSPVGHFVIRVMEHLDRSQYETVCYSSGDMQDELTNRFESAATIWRDVRRLSDQELAATIGGDRIDILFDLSGHSARNRLLVFARKPAPIQITWAGYVGTTGLAAIDYILADRYEIPAGAEAHYREGVLRMPDGYVTYAPSPFAPAVSSLPALKNGWVTFGSFNNPVKIGSQIVAVWSKILNRVPQSRLVLKHRAINYGAVAKRLANDFASHGIDPERVEFLGWSSQTALLAEYGRIDLALDTFPYNGGLTTCEALWMGVPVITCPGETFASRHSLSHLSNAGVRETIAGDFEEYVELAVSFASDLPRLAALRAGLRERMAGSPLCDGKRFAENLMRVLRGIWREWCQQAER